MTDPRDYYLRMRAAVEAGRPLPRDVAEWFLRGLALHENGGTLDAALDLQVAPGDAWRHPGRQCRRAAMERLFLEAADALHGRNDRSARALARALQRFEAPTLDCMDRRARDALTRLSLDFGLANIPRTRTPIAQILAGHTQAQRDDLV